MKVGLILNLLNKLNKSILCEPHIPKNNFVKKDHLSPTRLLYNANVKRASDAMFV